MSEVETNVPAAAESTLAPAPAAPLNAIQIVEQQIMQFIKQREQAIANVHAIEGALQSAQHLLQVFRAEEAKAKAAVESAISKAKAEAEKIAGAVESEATKVVGETKAVFSETEAKVLAAVDEVKAKL